MKTRRNNFCNKGFTTIELLVVLGGIAVVAFLVAVIITVSTGNFWYSEEGVLRKIKVEHPETTDVIDSSRSIWNYSEITVTEGGIQKKYHLNSNLLFNYQIFEIE